MTRIFFVRHAEPDHSWDEDRTKPLTDEGKEDSRQVTEALKDINLNYAISSPYKRSIDTIHECVNAHGIEIHTDERFRERQGGLDARNPENIRKRWENKDYHEEGGESLNILQQRNMKALLEVLDEHNNENIIIGTHGAALASILSYYDPAFQCDDYLNLIDYMPYIVRLDFDGVKYLGKKEILIIKKKFVKPIKKTIKEIVINQGADVCGVANIDRFYNAPKGFHPTDIYPECKSVIIFGVALPKGLTKVEPRLIYGHFNYDVCKRIDAISLQTAKEIEEKYQGIAVPMPCDGPYEYWDSEKMEGRGLISMKHSAVLAGIGTLGKNTLLINEKYGNLLILGAILTNLNLPSDPLAESICIEDCRLCIDNCPSHALGGESVNQYNCRTNTYSTNTRGFSTVDCNRCRTICPMRYGKRT